MPLHITVHASITPREWHHEVTLAVPPDYDQQDINAFVLHETERAVFEFGRINFGRRPTLTALFAATARLIAIRRLLEELPEGCRDQIQAILDITNDEAIAQYGTGDDG